MTALTLTIQGMGCGHCVSRVKQALGELAGVEVDAVEIGRAALRYDAARVTPESIRQAVTDAGYDVVAAEEAA